MSDLITNTGQVLWKAVTNPRKALRRAGILRPERAQPQETEVPVRSILRSGEGFIPSSKYARLVGEPLRASQRAIEGPHVAFLRDYLETGDVIFEPARFSTTRYYQNGVQCLSYTGSYFPYIRRREDIVQAAINFVAAFNGQRPERHGPEWGHNAPGDLIEVRPIYNSQCFELVQGNHRLASAFVKGEEVIRARILPVKVATPAQDILQDVLWLTNKLELYQPVDLPEVEGWRLVRKCSDRSDMMMAFLAKSKISSGSYVDVGSSYGWFVKTFQQAGFAATGVERDSFAIQVGVSIYGLDAKSFVRSDICDFLESCENTYDVVSCFSVAHHFGMGNGPVSAGELVRQLDRITGKVLFFDTGQSHEDWFKETLPSWNDDFLENLLRENSSFRRIHRLGRDSDGQGYFAGNYGRTLFACCR
jgi:hypothetical protein